MDAWMIREGMTLRPFGRESGDKLDKLPRGKPVWCEIKQPRNAKMHRLYWTLCHRIAEAVGCESEDVSFVLKKRTGHIKEVRTRQGIEQIPLSIAFHKMDQTDFDKFFAKCVDEIQNVWAIARPDILTELRDLLTEEA